MLRALVAVFVLGCGGPRPAAPVANTTREDPAVVDDRAAVEDTSVLVRKYAYEAYPSWVVAHPDRECPAALADLTEYMETPTTRDPWGTELRMFCGERMPAGAKGLAVQSAGADRKLDTADDVKSWE